MSSVKIYSTCLSSLCLFCFSISFFLVVPWTLFIIRFIAATLAESGKERCTLKWEIMFNAVHVWQFT